MIEAMIDPGTSPMETATSIAHALAAAREVEGVYVYGSVARGDATPESDIDLMVVGDKTKVSGRAIRDLVPMELRPARPSVAFYSLREFEDLLSAKPSFADHLVSEGRVLFDRHGKLRRLLDGHKVETVDVRGELEFELKRLEHFDRLEQFNRNFLFCLTHLFVIGKAVVMLILAAKGRPEYNKDRAFQALGALQPELRADVDAIAELKPFYRLVTRGTRGDLPYPYRDAEERVRHVIASIRRIAAVVE